MSEQFYVILTSIGKAKIANASALGNKVNFTHFALGDGNGQYYNPTEDQTGLKNEVYRTQINHVTVDEKNPNWIKISIVIPGNVGGFTIREAGVFDTEGNMLAIGKYPETYKPVVDQGSSKDLTINMILEVSNTEVVNLKIDPTVTLATKKDIEVLEQKMNDDFEWYDSVKVDKRGDTFTGEVKHNRNIVYQPQLKDYTETLALLDKYNSNIDLSLGNVFYLRPTANLTLTISNAVNDQVHSFTLIADNGGTPRTLIFPSSVKWGQNGIPNLAKANKTFILTFVSINGGTTWYGMLGGEFDVS